MSKLHTEALAEFPGGHVKLTVDCPDIGAMSDEDRSFVEEVLARMAQFVRALREGLSQ